jgi:hypothetical protein
MQADHIILQYNIRCNHDIIFIYRQPFGYVFWDSTYSIVGSLFIHGSFFYLSITNARLDPEFSNLTNKAYGFHFISLFGFH